MVISNAVFNNYVRIILDIREPLLLRLYRQLCQRVYTYLFFQVHHVPNIELNGMSTT